MPRYEANYDDIFYTASLVEFIGRKTLNKRSDVARAIGKEGFRNLVFLAEVNHCLSFEQVSDELVERYHIKTGAFDSVGACRYAVPSYLAIGSVYAKLAMAVKTEYEELPEKLYEVFTSGISDAISDFNSAFFYSSPSEIEYVYRTRYH